MTRLILLVYTEYCAQDLSQILMLYILLGKLVQTNMEILYIKPKQSLYNSAILKVNIWYDPLYSLT